MKDCVKQTELTNGTPAHLANLTKLEILYRQLQQRHQYDLEQHFAISESLKIKAKDAQQDLQKVERLCEEMRVKFQEEQTKSASKVSSLTLGLISSSVHRSRSANWKGNYATRTQQLSWPVFFHRPRWKIAWKKKKSAPNSWEVGRTN